MNTILQRLVLLVLMAAAASAGESLFRGYTVSAHTDASTRDPIGEIVSNLNPGDILTVASYAPEG